jgi:hypothetical protein
MYPLLSKKEVADISIIFERIDKDRDGIVTSEDIRCAKPSISSGNGAGVVGVGIVVYYPESTGRSLRITLPQLLSYNNAQREYRWID